ADGVWTISFAQVGGRYLYPDWVAVPVPNCRGVRELEHVIELGRFDPRYRGHAMDCVRAGDREERHLLAQWALDAAMASESAPRLFERDLVLFANAYAFRDAAGPVVHAVLWLPADADPDAAQPERIELA